ncbi:MAG: glycosyltransferase [Gammaproteobacteria bacterium]|nr:glycosyltransferase [Gammaproteobacteria bacterium]
MKSISNTHHAIALFIPGLNCGGAQKVVVNLANALVDLTDHPVHIVLARAEGEFLHEVHPEVKVVDLGKGRASRAILALAAYLRREKPVVLCSSLNYANVCAAIAWRLAGRPGRLVLREDNVVRAPQGRTKQKLHMYLMQRLMQWAYRPAFPVVAISQAVAETLSNSGIATTGQIKVIGNPIMFMVSDSDKVGAKAPAFDFGGRCICAIGRLTEQKGFDVLLDAFSQLHEDDLDLVILGEGSLRENLEKQAIQLGVAKRVHLSGFVSQPGRVLASAKLFVLSSRWEGFGNVLVEALAAGVPIVSTDCPGAPRAILRDGALGHLVPVDDPAALAEAMAEALHAPRGTKEARQERAQDFAATMIAKQYLEQAFALQVRGDDAISVKSAESS